MTATNSFNKRSTETLDYGWDFADLLQGGETIATATVAVPSGLTKAQPESHTASVVTVWLSGGTAGTVYTVAATITTSAARTFTRELYLYVLAPEESALPARPATTTREEPWNLLALEEWRYHFAYHPFHFWGMSGPLARVSASCDAVVRQHAWQSANAVGREEVRAAIRDAEALLASALGYAVAPRYRVATLPFPRSPDPRFAAPGYAGADGRWKTVRLPEGWVQELGVERLELIAVADAAYSDSDGDGLPDTFTLTAATTATDPADIAVYFATADRFDDTTTGERWRVAPVTVSIQDGIATIRGRAWLLVRPVLYEGATERQIDPAVMENYAAQIEVYLRYTHAGTNRDTAQAVLVWETAPYPAWASPTSATDAAGEAYALARAGIRDAETGTVTIGEAVWNAAAGTWSLPESCGGWGRPPDRVIVRYRAGLALENGRVAAAARPAVCNLAAALLARPICACETANRQLYEQQFDLSRAAGVNDEQYATHQSVLSNPFGTRRGAAYAWRWAEQRMLVRGFAP